MAQEKLFLSAQRGDLGDGIPDVVDLILERVEAVKKYLPQIQVIKFAAKIFMRIAQDYVIPLASDPDEPFPYTNAFEVNRLLKAIDEWKKQGLITDGEAGLILQSMNFHVDP